MQPTRFRPQPRSALFLGLLVLLSALPSAAPRLLAQSAGEPLIASRQYLGNALHDGTVVRTGASENDLGVATLAKDKPVTVVGYSPGYLRILPPEGTYCLVPKASVNLRGESGGEQIGRVTDKCSVRVGSTINQAIDATAARLAPGDEVRVVGEDSQYYHVTPPKEVFFFVAKDDVARVREVRVTETRRGWKVGELPAETPAETPSVTQTPDPTADKPADKLEDKLEDKPAAVPQVEEPKPADEGPAMTRDLAALPPGDDDGTAETPATSAPAPTVAEAAPDGPATRPSLVEAFRDLDARYVDAAALPLEQQPLAELKAEYEQLLAGAGADPAGAAIKPLIEARLKTIDIRQTALTDLKSIQSMREQMVARQQALAAEQDELATRAKRGNVTMYAAVGQVQPSSLQIGGGSLYRLCDPATGRTLIYLRASGEAAKSLGKSMEKFVGVMGETVNDGDLELKYVKVTKVADVAQSELFDTVAAELIPPSLVQKAAAVN